MVMDSSDLEELVNCFLQTMMTMIALSLKENKYLQAYIHVYISPKLL